MSWHEDIRQRALARLAAGADAAVALNDALRLLAKWRCVPLQNTLLRRHGTVVLDGPLRGMDFVARSAEGCHIPKLLGCYEQPLRPHVEAAIAAAYPLLINIGCAEGYYAVGLARRMPRTQVLAFDLDPAARAACAELAAKNGVAARVGVGERFAPEDFARHAGRRALVLCDIEGGERELLDPARAPALAGFDLIVESHDCLAPGTTALLLERFRATHEIRIVADDGQRQLPAAPDWFKNLAHLDQLLAVWEWRSGPTPWLVMRARQGGA